MTKTLTGIAIALALLALPATAQEAAQDADRDGEFFVGFAGSAVFPYDPKSLAGPGLKAGTGFTTAFGYAFKEASRLRLNGDTRESVSAIPAAIFPRLR